MRIGVAEPGCLRYGMCVLEAPELFALDDHDDVARVLVDPVPGRLAEQARTAADQCPMQALTIIED